jgi:hypothetical protein
MIINNSEVTAHEDGSISKIDRRNGKTIRTFGTTNDGGYKCVNIGGKLVLVHRVIAKGFLEEYSEDLKVDHIDGDPANNRLENIRVSTHINNLRAFQRKRKSGSSQYRGVSWDKRIKKWCAFSKVDGKSFNVGSFDNEREAAIARDAHVHSIGYPLEGLNFPENFCPVDASE